MLFTVTSRALPRVFYFFLLTQPLPVSTVKLLYTVKKKGGKPNRKPYPLYFLSNPYRNLSLRTLKIMLRLQVIWYLYLLFRCGRFMQRDTIRLWHLQSTVHPLCHTSRASHYSRPHSCNFGNFLRRLAYAHLPSCSVPNVVKNWWFMKEV